jgi:hypothetical protein
MGYLVAFHWGWLAAAAVMGLAMGWIAVVQRATGLSKRTLQIAAAILAVAVVVAASRLIPGRFGYWLDLGLAMLCVYTAGCALGSWLRERFVWRSAPMT